MTLKGALEQLPKTQPTQDTLREVLRLAMHRRDDWVPALELAAHARVPVSEVDTILRTLVARFVLDFDGTTDSYRYRSDHFNDIEVERYLKREDGQRGHVRANVEKFRREYRFR